MATKRSPTSVDPLYPVVTVAQLLGVCRSHVYRLIRADRLPAVNIAVRGVKTRVPASAVTAFLAANHINRKEPRR